MYINGNRKDKSTGNRQNITKNKFTQALISVKIVPFKGTLMQIRKSPNMLVFI